MRIALVHRDLHHVTRGGICTLYRALADHLAAAGCRITLITQTSPHPIQPTRRIEVITVPRTDDLPVHRTAVARVLDALAPDVAECSTWEAELLTYASRPAAERAPVVVRGDLSAATMGAAELAADEAALCRAADAMLAVSRFAATDLAAAYRIPAPPVLPNGVDRRRFHPAQPHLPSSGEHLRLGTDGQLLASQPLPRLLATDAAWASYFTADRKPGAPVRLVWVGKLTRMKGYDRLARFIPALRGRAQLLLVLGHGQIHYPVEPGAHDHVLTVRDLDEFDLPAVYRAADYLLSTSRWEGYGLAIAEALACGTPALLPADLAVADELLNPNVTGATWQADTDLLTLLDTRPRLTGALPATYDWTANARATLALYQDLHARAARTQERP
ncbi:MAG: glycosyltransferase family 4 protein [Streptomycetaceae bacterium]|nr:glycosyltransferase family 4 protein [Streptomycetaceae bacterium]